MIINDSSVTQLIGYRSACCYIAHHHRRSYGRNAVFRAPPRPLRHHRLTTHAKLGSLHQPVPTHWSSFAGPGAGCDRSVNPYWIDRVKPILRSTGCSFVAVAIRIEKINNIPLAFLLVKCLAAESKAEQLVPAFATRGY